MKGKLIIKYLLGTLVILSALVYLVSTIQSSWAYDISVDEFLSDQNARSHRARVGGIVKKGSVEVDLEKVHLKFVLAGHRHALPVSYHNAVPENFEEDREVLVEGTLDENGVFQAQKLITKCESKYKAKVRDK